MLTNTLSSSAGGGGNLIVRFSPTRWPAEQIPGERRDIRGSSEPLGFQTINGSFNLREILFPEWHEGRGSDRPIGRDFAAWERLRSRRTTVFDKCGAIYRFSRLNGGFNRTDDNTSMS